MMGPGFGNAIGAKLVNGLILAVVLAASLGALAMWGIPKVWAWVVPIIHAATA